MPNQDCKTNWLVRTRTLSQISNHVLTVASSFLSVVVASFFIFESKTFFLGEPLIDRESYYNLLSMNMLLQFILLRGSGKIYGFSAHFRWKTSENSRMAQKNRLRIIFMGSLGGLFLHCRKIYIRLHWMASRKTDTTDKIKIFRQKVNRCYWYIFFRMKMEQLKKKKWFQNFLVHLVHFCLIQKF